VVAGAERRHHVAALAQHARVALRSSRAPDRRMRLLPGTRPDVYLAIMEMLALPVERAVVGGHRLEDEIVRFPEPVHDTHRILVGRGELKGNALDEAHIDPPAGEHS